MSGPYRDAGKFPVEPLRCCGICDQAGGGCLFQLRIRGIPAGRSSRASSTPPLVSYDEGVTWQLESPHP